MSSSKAKARAVVVAAGRGARTGFSKNKVLMPLGGTPVLLHSLRTLSETGRFSEIAVVVSDRDRAECEALLHAWQGTARLIGPVVGGDTRQASVLAGLKALPEDTDLVAIHDAARPFVTPGMIVDALDSAQAHGSGVLCAPVVDTIKQILPDGRVATPDRSTLRAAQTPQCFRYRDILNAHLRAQAEGIKATDDAALWEHCNGDLHLVTHKDAGRNRKLTTREDFMNESMPQMRIGTGYDAHRLKTGRRLVLCGVEIPYERGLDGHSDADAPLHALIDALLGALGRGDIGRLFPDTDPAYKDIDSKLLLKHTMELVRSQGFFVVNADVIIVAQRPKLVRYLPKMAAVLAELLETPNVNVKATTTEHMGFEGEEVGISAQAAVLLAKQTMV